MGQIKQEWIESAQATEQMYGVPASVTLAQFILESGWGKSGLTVNYNNGFGVTANDNYVGKKVWATNSKGEDGHYYRVYDSLYESFLDHAKVLQQSNYTQYTDKAETIEEYVKGVKAGGYATDPDYVSKLMNLINNYGLTQYDSGDWKTGGTGYVGDNAINVGGAGSGLLNVNDSDSELKWWGDIVVMILCVLLVVLAVVFLVLSFNGGSIKNVATNALDKATGGTLKTVSNAIK